MDPRKATLEELDPYFKLLIDYLRTYCEKEILSDNLNDWVEVIRKYDLDTHGQMSVRSGTPAKVNFPLIVNNDYFIYLFFKHVLDIDLKEQPEILLQMQAAADAHRKSKSVVLVVYKDFEIKIPVSFRNAHKHLWFTLEDNTKLIFEEGITSLENWRIGIIEGNNATIVLPSTLTGKLNLIELFSNTAYHAGGNITIIITPVKDENGKEVSPFEVSQSQIQELKNNKINLIFKF